MKKIYYHGTIYTMDEDLPLVEAICVEHGRILATGSMESIMGYKEDDTQLIDLQKHTMLPSFIDTHSHFIGLATSLAQCDLTNAQTFEDIENALKRFIEENDIKAGEWVIGNGYDHNFLIEKSHPDKDLLNRVSRSHPMMIMHSSKHMGVVNSCALLEAHLTYDTPDPVGGKYGRNKEKKELDGYLEEDALMMFTSCVPMMDMETLMKLVDKAQQIYASYGITTVQDGFMTAALFQILLEVSKQQCLKLDVIGFVDANAHSITQQHPEFVKTYVNRFKIGGYKIILDGSPQGRTAWMQTPYEQDPSYYGYSVLSDERLYEVIEMSMKENLQLLAHCNGDAAAAQYILQFRKASAAHPEQDTCRPVMIHAQLVRKDQLVEMSALHMIPSFFIAHTYYWGDIHMKNFGKDRAAKISSAKTAEDLGIIYTFHQDTPVILPNMMESVWCAVNRITKEGVGLGEEECVSPYVALKAITKYAAYQYFEEQEKGTITAGKLADLVILDHDPFTIDTKLLKDIRVVQTIKEGAVIFQAESAA